MSALFPHLWIAVLAAALVLFAACDTAPGPTPLDRTLPEVADLRVGPDTIRLANLLPDRIANGQALVDVTAGVTARDADGTVDRVLVLIDPSYSTSGPVIAQLPRVEESDRFEGTLRYSVAADRANVLMVRAFAVDSDSLTSNQLIGQIYVLPDTTSEAE